METTFHLTEAVVVCTATLELRRVNPCNVGQPHCSPQHPEEGEVEGATDPPDMKGQDIREWFKAALGVV